MPADAEVATAHHDLPHTLLKRKRGYLDQPEAQWQAFDKPEALGQKALDHVDAPGQEQGDSSERIAATKRKIEWLRKMLHWGLVRTATHKNPKVEAGNDGKNGKADNGVGGSLAVDVICGVLLG